MIDDEEEIREEKKSNVSIGAERTLRIAVDQSEDGENENRKLTDDVEKTDDQDHPGDSRFRLQPLSNDLRMQSEFFGLLQANLSVDYPN